MSISYHNRIALQELREARRIEAEALAARERAAEEERALPVRIAEEQFAETFKQYYALRRENLLTAPDEEFTLDPDAPTWFATQADADRHNKTAADLFVRNNPDYYPCPENVKTMATYLEKNGQDRIVSAKTLQVAHGRLREFGLLVERPAELTPEPEPLPTPRRKVTVEAPSPAPEPAGEYGYNSETGEREFKSAYLIARMSAAEYKRWARIPKEELDLARLVRR